jgi:hypothetical protein
LKAIRVSALVLPRHLAEIQRAVYKPGRKNFMSMLSQYTWHTAMNV